MVIASRDLPILSGPHPHAIPIHALRPADLDRWLEGRHSSLRTLCDTHGFRAQAAKVLLVPFSDGRLERVLFGLGEETDSRIFGQLAQSLPDSVFEMASAPREFGAGRIALAWIMGAYRYTAFKPASGKVATLVLPDGCDETELRALGETIWQVRDLVNMPANILGPDALALAVRELGDKFGAQITEWVGEDLLAHNFPLIHAVGKANPQAPRLVELLWRAPDASPDAPKITLVGKGVTFDTGGLDIKPSSGMRIMKKDMGGAAHALGLAALILRARLPVRLRVLIAIAENSIAGNAFRPGDVIVARNGASVEIDNTDAEGRLILADALVRASEDEPDLVLDFATLTGAARVALGPDIVPFYTEDDALAGRIEQAGREQDDPLWRMPLWRPYQSELDSPIAAMKNASDSPMAGSIIGALFLQRFVKAKAWVHFDIYAWNPRDKPARPQGGEAQGLRAMWRLLRQTYG